MAIALAKRLAVSAAVVAAGFAAQASEVLPDHCVASAAIDGCRAPRQVAGRPALSSSGPGVLLIQKKISARTDLRAGALEPPSAEPLSAEQLSAEPLSAEPISAEPLSAQPLSAEPLSAEPSLEDEATSPARAPVQALALQPVGWPTSGEMKGSDWCQGEVPMPQWTLMDQCGRNGSPLEVRILSYNLYWWNLFNQRGGNGGSAGKLIAGANSPENKFDVMGFQECDDADRILRDTGFPNSYGVVRGPHAVAAAYRKSRWNLLAEGAEDIAEDAQIPGQYYGRRCVVWMRLQHWETGKTMFFLNHHGPLPVNSGGKCGGEAVAYNLLRVIGRNADKGDLVVVVGDFNAGPGSAAVQTLRTRINEVFTGTSFGGVDHIFSSCNTVSSARKLGNGGSDHDAITASVLF